jgi:hypothetical protein
MLKMWRNNKRVDKLQTLDLNTQLKIHELILHEVKDWVVREIAVSNNEHIKFIDRAIGSLVTINLESLKYFKGRDLLLGLVADIARPNSGSQIFQRLRTLNAWLHLKIGNDLPKYIENAKTFYQVLKLDDPMYVELNKQLGDILWLLPIIQKVWNQTQIFDS